MNDNQTTSRVLAAAAGLKRYRSARRCPKGHLGERYTSNGGCVDCLRLYQIAQHFVGPPKPPKGRNMANVKRLRDAHYEANKAQYINRARKWREDNIVRRQEIARNWVRNNPQKALASVRARQAAKMQRTPPWADLAAIQAFYLACPVGYQVDHIVPLRGKRVSGLHVLHNLQYLPARENLLKGNKYEGV